MNISEWLNHATQILKDSHIKSARLDAELILAATLKKSRTHLHAHPSDQVDPAKITIASAQLDLRKNRVPVAYILGYKEFYGRKFTVSPHVLVPRPESEDLITKLLEISTDKITNQKTLIDVGTGSGCLGITAKLERPNLSVILSDISAEALNIARANAKSLNANIKIRQQNLLSSQSEPVDYIIANLPYVDKNWPTSPELKHEPQLALFADKNGLALIYKLIIQTKEKLNSGGFLILEADPAQHQNIIEQAEKYNLTHLNTSGYCLVFEKLKAKF